MNTSEAAQLVAVLHGAYPDSYFDGAVAEVFMNSLITNDFEITRRAVMEWTKTVTRFPTIAELNGFVRRLQGREDNVRELPSRDDGVDMERAKAAFSRGYRQARAKLGDDNETIERKLAAYVRKFPGSIPGMST